MINSVHLIRVAGAADTLAFVSSSDESSAPATTPKYHFQSIAILLGPVEYERKDYSSD